METGGYIRLIIAKATILIYCLFPVPNYVQQKQRRVGGDY